MRNEAHQHIAGACARLVADAVVAPLVLGGAEERAWADCDLASLTELRLGEQVRPATLDPTDRAALWARASDEPECAPSERDFELCLWILEGGEPIGTVALARHTWGSQRVRLSSLYVKPAHRGRGIATRALGQIRDELARASLGIQLETHWVWRPSLRFYLHRGFWVRRWKHELDLWCHGGTPAPIVRLEERTATLAIEIQGVEQVLVRAERDGDLLTDFDHGNPRSPFWGDASTTLALHLALNGWPLLATPGIGQLVAGEDAVHPRALAHRIVRWEALARANGWQVATRRVAGLRYTNSVAPESS